ncbi:MAG: hypothetical protein WD049_01100 [Candidatus Paceibacterota bacterium]
MRQAGVVLFIVALLVVIAGLIYWAVGTNAPRAGEPEIVSFAVERPDLIVLTRGEVSSVAIFGVPETQTGTTSTSTDDDVLLGEPGPEAKDAEGITEWRLAIPSEPMNLAVVYAEAYDKDGTVVDRKSLPFTGPQEVRGALWDGQSGASLTLGIGESGTIDEMELTLNSVTSDTRCGPSMSCPDSVVTADVTARIAEEDSVETEISTSDQTSVGTYILQILSVTPKVTDKMQNADGIDPSAYELRILVFREAKL